MRKQERYSEPQSPPPFFYPNESWGADLIPVWVHHTYPDHPNIHPHLLLPLLKNRNKNLFTLFFQLPSSFSYIYLAERSHYNAKRWTYTPQGTQAHTEEKNFIPLNRPPSSWLCLFVSMCICVQGHWREHAKCKVYKLDFLGAVFWGWV